MLDVEHLTDTKRTLLIPLVSRARGTRAGSLILRDPKAVEIIDKLDIDSQTIDKFMHESTDFVQIARARVMDDLIREFLSNHPRATVVNMGAGLDTAFFRVDNGLLNWIDVDLPEVIELRKELIPESERNRCIVASLLDPNWMKEIPRESDGLFFFSAGVLVYLRVDEARELVSKLAATFPGAELVFDFHSKLSTFFGNRSLKLAGMGSARLRWGMRTARGIAKWNPNIQVIEESALFSAIEDSSFPDQKTAETARMMDRMHAMTIAHLRFT